MPKQYRVRRLAGRCRHGAERGGVVYHAVPTEEFKALCGAEPGRLSAGWSEYGGDAVTCERCLKKLEGSDVEFIEV